MTNLLHKTNKCIKNIGLAEFTDKEVKWINSYIIHKINKDKLKNRTVSITKNELAENFNTKYFHNSVKFYMKRLSNSDFPFFDRFSEFVRFLITSYYLNNT